MPRYALPKEQTRYGGPGAYHIGLSNGRSITFNSDGEADISRADLKELEDAGIDLSLKQVRGKGAKEPLTGVGDPYTDTEAVEAALTEGPAAITPGPTVPDSIGPESVAPQVPAQDPTPKEGPPYTRSAVRTSGTTPYKADGTPVKSTDKKK